METSRAHLSLTSTWFAGPVFLFALGNSEERSLITALSSATHSLPGATDMSAPPGLVAGYSGLQLPKEGRTMALGLRPWRMRWRD